MRQKVGEQTSPSPFSLLKSQWAPYRIEIRTLPFPQLMHDGNTMRRAALLLFQLSELIPKGRRRGEIQTEVVAYLEHRNAQLYSVAAPVLPLPWAMPLNLSSSAQHQSSASANKKVCSGSWECPTAALQSSSGGHLLSRWPMKRFMFSFHISSIFLGCGSLPGRSCINLRKRYPEVCHLINSPALLY